MLSVINASYKDGYRISLLFSDHSAGIVDLEAFILDGKIKPFQVLADKKKFKAFQVDYTLMWGDELDLAPEFLYFSAF
ncbi:MAG TPA: DUF2442 domain-containing protein [Psychromonas hadalis]|nr:DUF2442 domain-containing protein [Psychromonas hadalis]